jgi:GDPmannose 4,6-dehydratase
LIGCVNEESPAQATCLYSIGKIAARDLISQYRRHHDVAATNLILFNHESPRRVGAFLLPKIAQGIAAAQKNPASRLKVRTLDFWIDWAAADELSGIAVDIALNLDGKGEQEGEFVLASGTTHHARSVVYDLFARYGLDGESGIVEELAPSDPGPSYHVSLDRLERLLGRRPVKTVADIVEDMIGVPTARSSDRVI